MSSILEDAYTLKKLCNDYLKESDETNKKIVNNQLQVLAEHYWGNESIKRILTN